MAKNTVNTYLMTGTGTPLAYTPLVAIKDYPDLGGDVEQIEVTTLSDTSRKYIAGLQSGDELVFTANYEYTDYDAIKTIEAAGVAKNCRVAFGKSGTNYGTDGYFDFEAFVSVKVLGKGVNEAREMQITCILTSAITHGVTSVTP